MSKIALNMIVSGQERVEELQRALNSIADHVDGIFITITTETKNNELRVAAERYGAVIDYQPNKFFHKVSPKMVKWLRKLIGGEPRVSVGDKIFDFSLARNHNMAQVPKEFDWILWMDADDVFRGGDKLRAVIAEAEAGGVESVFLNYIYQAEIEDGKIKNVIIEHLRERLIRNSGVYQWVAPIHETLIEQRPTRKVDAEQCDVLHLSENPRREGALRRNLKTLEYSLWQSKGADPRPIYYLGKSYFDLFMQQHDKQYLSIAKKLFEAYVMGTEEYENKNKSGWAEERSQCWEYLVESYRHLGELNNAIKCAHNALIEDERFPSIYINLGLCYLVKGDYPRAKFWVKLAGKIEQPKTTLIVNPKDLAQRAMEIIYHAGIHLSNLDEAWAAAVKLVELDPKSKEMQDRLNFTSGLRREKQFTKYMVDLVNYLHSSGEADKVKLLLAATPSFIANNPIMTNIRNQVIPPKVWEENEVAIYCGPGFTTWSPKSLTRENEAEFVGGSEEAVIYASQALSKQGWKVTVYADPGVEAGKHNGVTWSPYFQFNNLDEFNILIGWRAIGFFDQELKAKKKYVWCHDVLNQLDHTPERLGRIEKIFVLSQAHRDTIPTVPDDKVFITSNGYHEHFPKLEPKNDPHKLIWSSSYDRGLEQLLNLWPEVKKAVPEAELHIFYGWKLFKKFYGDNPERMQWLEKIEAKMNQEGITHHGRVSQPELEKWYKKCGIWAYPTDFYEINCISAIKAQLWGAVPVCMNHAALKETVQHGKKIEGDIYDYEIRKIYQEALIEALKDETWQKEQREKMMPWARETYSWEKVTEKWSQEFKQDELGEAAKMLVEAKPEAEQLLPVQLQEKYGYKASY